MSRDEKAKVMLRNDNTVWRAIDKPVGADLGTKWVSQIGPTWDKPGDFFPPDSVLFAR